MDAELLAELNRARAARKVVAVLTWLKTGAKEIFAESELEFHDLAEQLLMFRRTGKSGVVELDGQEIFVEMHVPPPRLVIIGAVHISQALYPMAQACDFDVTIIDPRSAFATPERFDDVSLHAEWPDDLLPQIALDPHTAVAAVTHDPKIDDSPLKAALHAGCFYVGALGSRKTHAARLERFRDAGLDQALLESIHAPIGLNIGAASPAEIAVAVMAQVIGALRQGDVS